MSLSIMVAVKMCVELLASRASDFPLSLESEAEFGA